VRNPDETLDDAWMDDAACRGVDPDLFFPVRFEASVDVQAKAVCAGCPVQAECLDYALDHGIKHGIWGGKSERQRRALRGSRGRRVRCRRCGGWFEARSTAVYCGPDCRAAAHNDTSRVSRLWREEVG
jgi:WhiB family redox-sensing transcriptional regulator